MLPDMEKLRRCVQEKLSSARFRHSVAVQKQAMLLAKRYGADWYKAGVAGLVHDVCKDMSHEAQLNYLHACGILLDVLTLENPPVWHAVAGARYAREALGVEDREILDAVRYHTTGRADMTLLDKVLYVADLTSEDRDYPDVAAMRQLAETSLDEALRYAFRHSVVSLAQQYRPLTRDTWEAYNYYLNPQTADS